MAATRHSVTVRPPFVTAWCLLLTGFSHGLSFSLNLVPK
jgi:hypothetical protein